MATPRLELQKSEEDCPISPRTESPITLQELNEEKDLQSTSSNSKNSDDPLENDFIMFDDWIPVPDEVPAETASSAPENRTEKEESNSLAQFYQKNFFGTPRDVLESTKTFSGELMSESSVMNLRADHFQTDSVICKGSETKSPMWPTPGVSAFPTPFTQTIGFVFFYVEGGESDWQPDVSLATTVLDPNNSPVDVHMTKSHTSDRCIARFLALTPGYYTVTVSDGLLKFNVIGSPFNFPVSRNYLFTFKPRLTINNEPKSWGVTYSQFSEKIYVADQSIHQVSIYSANGVLEKKFGCRGSAPGTFYRPTGIAVDNRNRRLVITDKDNHRVCVYTLDGKFIFTFGSNGFHNGEFSYPWGVAVSPKDATIAVADTRNHRIQLFDSNGNFLRKYCVFETQPFEFKPLFDYPRGLTFDSTGESIFVTDFNIQAVFKFNEALTEKTNITPFGLNLSRPQGVAVDAVGNLLVCDCRNNLIRVINPEGDLITSIPGHATETFCYPEDVTVMPSGEILVVDANSKVTVI